MTAIPKAWECFWASLRTSSNFFASFCIWAFSPSYLAIFFPKSYFIFLTYSSRTA